MEAALKHMGPLKFPSLDGFDACFYEKHWDIVGDDMCAAVLNILNVDSMVFSFNSTLIALIPKKCNSSVVNEFRSICLCNVVYKLVSKVLANS